MKKITALVLAIMTVAMILCGCSNVVDVSKIKAEDHINLGDYGNITVEDVKAEYEKERLRLSDTATQFNVGWGYTVRFNLRCDIKVEEGNTVSYTKYEPYCFEGENNIQTINIYEDTDNAYRALFDSAFVNNVKNAADSVSATTRRTITVGTAFDFEYDIPYKSENKELAGKTVRFTVTPVKVLPPVYEDAQILESLNKFFDAHTEDRDVVAYGDIVSINVEGKSDGVIVEGQKYDMTVITVGYSVYPKEFDDALVGVKRGRTASFEITFPEDWYDADLAGLTVNYSVKINEAYSYNKAIDENTDYSSLYELKEALRLELFAKDMLMYVVYARSSLKSAPEALYNEYYKYFKNVNDEQVDLASKNYGYTKEEIINTAWGSQSGYEAHLKELTDDALLQTLVCKAVAEKLGYGYTNEMYKADLEEFTKDYNAGTGKNYTSKQIENESLKNLLRQMFLEQDLNEQLIKTVEWLPVLGN